MRFNNLEQITELSKESICEILRRELEWNVYGGRARMEVNNCGVAIFVSTDDLLEAYLYFDVDFVNIDSVLLAANFAKRIYCMHISLTDIGR